jgi:hypothetical protein
MYSMLQKFASSDLDVRWGLKPWMTASKVLSSVKAGVGDNDAWVGDNDAFVLCLA